MVNNKRFIIVGNWKMHLNTMQASILLHRLQERVRLYRSVEIVLAPSMLVLQPLSLQLDRRKFRLAAQNAYFKDEGTYTGEVSISMLRDLVHYVIVGHSERRNVFGETLSDTSEKVAACLRNDISPIICVGETASQYVAKETKHVLSDQLTAAFKCVSSEEVEKVVIAYEPVWAISSGSDYKGHKTVEPDQLAKITRFIRTFICDRYGDKAATAVRVLYGGSVNSDNVSTYLPVEGVDGFLVGGASIKYYDFSQVVDKSYHYVQQTKEV